MFWSADQKPHNYETYLLLPNCPWRCQGPGRQRKLQCWLHPLKIKTSLTKQKSKATIKKKVWRNQNKLTNKQKTKKRERLEKSNKSRQQDMSDDEDEDWPCLICCEPYSRTRPRDVWVQCQLCLHWAHEECTPGEPQFVCPNCDSDDSD